MNILLQPCGDRSKVNKEKTLDKKIELQEIKDVLSKKEIDFIQNNINASSSYVWGVTPNQKEKWNKIQKGDLVLFCSRGIFAFAEVSVKIHNKILSNKIWGIEKNTGRSWEYVYFLKNLKNIHIEKEEFYNVIGYNSNYTIRGFTILSKEKKQAFLEAFDEKIGDEYKEIEKERKQEIKNEEEKIKSIEKGIYELNVNSVNISNCQFKTIKYVSDIKNEENKKNEEINDGTMQNKVLSKKDKKQISDKAKQILGIKGEFYVYNMLMNKNKELLKQLEIKDYKEVNFYNKDYDFETMPKDLSEGHGCDIELILCNNKHLKLEIKSSWFDIGYFTMTGNEYAKSKEEKDNFFIIKLDNMQYMNQTKNKVGITVICNPYRVVQNNIRKVKEITLYT